MRISYSPLNFHIFIGAFMDISYGISLGLSLAIHYGP